MTALPLFAVVPTWVSNWLTPVWILSLGALAGLAILAVLWILALIVSSIPGIGKFADDKRQRSTVIAVLAVLCFVGLSAAIIGPNLETWQADETEAQNVALSILLLAPGSLAIAIGLVCYSSRRIVLEIPNAVREGPLWPIFILTVALAVFALVGSLVVAKPRDLLASLWRTPFVGSSTIQAVIPAATASDAEDPPQHEVEVSFRPDELQRIIMSSDQSLTVDSAINEDLDIRPMFEVLPDDQMIWIKTEQAISPFEGDEVTELFFRNYGASDATLNLTIVTQPEYPEIWSVIFTAGAVVAVFLLYLLQSAAVPKVSAVGLATLKSEIAQPLFLILMCIGLVALLLFIWIPYNTFGEDIKVLKDSGMTLIMVLCIIQAVWASSTSISDEIEGRTALTVLSKPLGRRSFILGKYMGIFWTVAVMFILLGVFFLLTVAYKPIYDARESSAGGPTWQISHFEMVSVIPGLVLAFMETAVLAAISVAISTRLPMLANFIISFAVYVLGHLTPLLVQVSVKEQMFEAVVFVAQLISTILPVLDHFSIQAAVAAGIGVPYDYLAWALLYCLMYGAIALLLALVLFEDRDLA